MSNQHWINSVLWYSLVSRSIVLLGPVGLSKWTSVVRGGQSPPRISSLLISDELNEAYLNNEYFYKVEVFNEWFQKSCLRSRIEKIWRSKRLTTKMDRNHNCFCLGVVRFSVEAKESGILGARILAISQERTISYGLSTWRLFDWWTGRKPYSKSNGIERILEVPGFHSGDQSDPNWINKNN